MAVHPGQCDCPGESKCRKGAVRVGHGTTTSYRQRVTAVKCWEGCGERYRWLFPGLRGDDRATCFGQNTFLCEIFMSNTVLLFFCHKVQQVTELGLLNLTVLLLIQGEANQPQQQCKMVAFTAFQTLPLLS